jgi:hypothetical protein
VGEPPELQRRLGIALGMHPAGGERGYQKKILELMRVDGLTR